MNKNAIKRFAIAARNRLIATASDRAGMLGITKEKISQPKSRGTGFEVYETAAGTENTLNRGQIFQRSRLVAQVEERGFDVVMEEVAYTWFNRICAIRFMEVNDYLPTRVRVLSSLKEGKNEPDLLTEAPNVDLGFSEKEREWILTAKEQNSLDELFSMLFIKQCNKLSEVLPGLFEATEDYTEMLLSLSYTNKDDVIRMLVDGVDEKEFNVTTPDENGNPTGQVEIIGWLYQYYNTELKDDTFAQLKKNVKISKERIPAATQLFTPDWIVRYMVENSVGRIWIEHLRAVDPATNEKATAERFGWKYYLPEAEQEPEVNVKLAEIRKSYKELKPEDILCIDPCMGSGHIIVAQFDVLMDIYKSVGYGERDAAFEIVEHNLHGLDIDRRAYQLAYFAVMMKGRQYNRRFFRGKDMNDIPPQPKVYAFVDSNDVNYAQLKYFGAALNELEKNNALNQIKGLLDTFKDAREYGSILNVENYDWDLLRRFVSGIEMPEQMTLDSMGLDQTKYVITEIIVLGEVLARKYDAVVTNPPYMGWSGMGIMLSDFVKKHYSDCKSDLFAVFIKRCMAFTKHSRYQAMITQHTWMFLSTFESLRNSIVQANIINMMHLGARAFDEISGEVVQTVSFVLRNDNVGLFNGIYLRLIDGISENEKEKMFFDSQYAYMVKSDAFIKVPGKPIAYWLSERILNIFDNRKLYDKAPTKQGTATADNNKYLRLWSEVALNRIAVGITSSEQSLTDKRRWYPYNKGGSYRKWYGNRDYVIDWQEDGKRIRSFEKSVVRNPSFYFREGITWSDISTSGFSARYTEGGFVFDSSGPMCFPQHEDIYYVLGLLNSKVSSVLLELLAPTYHFREGPVGNIPLIQNDKSRIEVEKLVKESIALSKNEWDSFETSFGFKHHPIAYGKTVKESYEDWKQLCENNFYKLKSLEEEINRIFIEAYALQSELNMNVEEKDVTVRRGELSRDIRSLISYAVGCMFGRYSLDKEGLSYAGGNWDSSKYMTYTPDKDNIIPITDEEYFEDDIVGLFCEWLKKVYGTETIEENLDFIAKALGNKGDTSREVIRNYFLNDFFKDHCNTYSVTGSGKRPIYWLFDSGKQNGFKALVYLHRYDQDTVGRVRTDYLHKTQKAIEQAMQGAQYTLDNSRNGTEKARATKRISKYTKQLAEIQLYDEAIAHIANQRIALDLDDGVKVNYAKFQGVEVAREGMKTVKVDLLARI